MPANRNVWTSGIATLAGIWAIVAPLAWSVGETLTWSNAVAGAGIALLAGYSAYRAYDGESIHAVATGLATLLGLWVLASPFVLADPGTTLVASNAVTGAVAAIAGGYALYDEGAVGASAARGSTA